VGGGLKGWAPYGLLRFILVIGSLTVMEFFVLFVNLRSRDDSVPPHWRLIFGILAIALPVCVMAGGFFGSRALFLIGSAAALLTAVWPLPKYEPPVVIVPEGISVEKMVEYVGVDRPEANRIVLERIKQHPDWVERVVKVIDDWPFFAVFMLTLKRTPFQTTSRSGVG